ncbi:hypothetical protein B9T25_06460 [Acinetobacter sp. ANC 4470]|uniref:phage baseplate protein n=1 Tax=Acinetobacter sp. ANC 4470 TaxID=1977881 RepID=UPI000A331F74|nr:hypothetical protein [Acinetobacter sp. ANC 4470]OTG68320.1 hypothetical protein B9T25_06460 [Acinetobacter sp. ANC 4470]
MKRIDTVNARPDINGDGKTGFHDNADISGQDATYIDPSWCNSLQEEIANAIEGFGTELNPNAKNQLYIVLKALADDIADLKQDVKVGNLFLTMQNFADSEAVAAYKGYGTWQSVGDGHALVTKASAANAQAPSFMKTIGQDGGEYKHQLTTDELPVFKLNFETGWPAGGSPPDSTYLGGWNGFSNDEAQDGLFRQNTSSIGNDDPFDVVQPSITIGVWERLT